MDKVLVSVGRKPYTEGLNLTKVGVKKDNKGRIEVNNKLQTSINNIYLKYFSTNWTSRIWHLQSLQEDEISLKRKNQRELFSVPD